ncbi:MAG: hypothetical protein EON54_16655 [Alcaligenaceae bacterium]|nr:MAG: hypothetical protein EON54_16655 [Alcaligenaceae bacterium]
MDTNASTRCPLSQKNAYADGKYHNAWNLVSRNQEAQTPNYQRNDSPIKNTPDEGRFHLADCEYQIDCDHCNDHSRKAGFRADILRAYDGNGTHGNDW